MYKKIMILAAVCLPLSHVAIAREPKATVCDMPKINYAVKNLLAVSLNQSKEEQANLEIRDVELTDMSYDLNNREVTTNTVKWGYKNGEMSANTYSLEIVLSSARLDQTGQCQIRAMTMSDIIQ